MQRSSGSIGSLVAALAKAQGELTNPEKSLVGTIPANGPGRATTRRFATPPSQVGSTLYAKSWANMRSPPCKRPPSIRLPGSSI